MTTLLLMASLVIAPISDAILRHSEKTPIGSVLRSAEWARMPHALRNRAQQSAGVESARVVQRIQDGVREILTHYRNENGAVTDRSGLIRDITQLAVKEGLEPADPKLRGTIQDITSERRAELIYNQQMGDAYGHANWKGNQDEDALDATPAQELVRIRDAAVPRDWLRRWIEAGGTVFDGGRLIALKSDPIWERISRFGNPWPPFDFNSGMWVEDVSREEAEELGLLATGQTVPPTEKEFNDRQERSIRDLSPALKQNLQSLFGNQVEIDSETIKWKGDAHEFEPFTADIRALSRRVFSGSARELGSVRLGDDGTPGVADIAQRNAQINGVEISAVAAGRKPLFHEHVPDLATPETVAALQRHLPSGVIAAAEDGHLYVYHPDLIGRFLEADKPLLPQIHGKTLAGRNGLLLGYGKETIGGDTRVFILNADGIRVQGFYTDSKMAGLYGAARAKDFTDATGQPHTFDVIRRGGAQ